MINKEEIINMYNKISDNKIDINEFLEIFPKLQLILNNVKLDNIEIIDLIDTLLEFKKYNKINSINDETIKILLKIANIVQNNLEGNLYFALMLKNLLLPYDLNKCEKKEETLLFLSEFELFLELMNKTNTKKDYDILWDYNSSLVMLIFEYKKSMELYKNYEKFNPIISTTISHMATILYFNQEKYEKKYILMYKITKNIIENYQRFINYYYEEGIYNNFSKLCLENDEIEKEYIVSKKMLDYIYNIEKEEEKKRKC